MKFVGRYLLAFLFSGFAFWTLVGWWHSTRYWMAWVAETPFGVFRIISESSLFGIGGQVMSHEHRWSFYKNADEITGDSMVWLSQSPIIRQFDQAYLLMVPYWQLMIGLLFVALACFLGQKALIAKKKNRSR